MLCNVGGQERTVHHYATLLRDAGLTMRSRHPLPLEFSVLRVTTAPAAQCGDDNTVTAGTPRQSQMVARCPLTPAAAPTTWPDCDSSNHHAVRRRIMLIKPTSGLNAPRAWRFAGSPW